MKRMTPRDETTVRDRARPRCRLLSGREPLSGKTPEAATRERALVF